MGPSGAWGRLTVEPVDAADAGLHIAHALNQSGFKYAIGGALALGAHGVPRGTLDVDINVFVTAEQLPALIACLKNLGVKIDENAARARARLDGMFVGKWNGIRIDVFVPSIPFSDEAERTRVLLKSAEEAVWFLSAEALAVFKLLFFRPKDIADLERLIASCGSKLNHQYVHDQVAEMMGGDDDRVQTWDRLIRQFSQV